MRKILQKIFGTEEVLLKRNCTLKNLKMQKLLALSNIFGMEEVPKYGAKNVLGHFGFIWLIQLSCPNIFGMEGKN